jgi:hypothetical protein
MDRREGLGRVDENSFTSDVAALENAHSELIQDLEVEKIFDGYQKSKTLFDAYHNAFLSNESLESSALEPTVETVKTMSQQLRDMKVAHIYAQKKDLIYRQEYCKKENVWWLSKATEISNIIFDLFVVITILGEEFYVDAVTYFTNSTAFNATLIEEQTTPSYWLIAVVSLSFIISKFRFFAQNKAEKIETERSILTKILFDGDEVIKEYQSKLYMWKKVVQLSESGSLLDLEKKGVIKKRLNQFYSAPLLLSNVSKNKKHIVPRHTDIDQFYTKKCCSRDPVFVLRHSDLIQIRNKIHFSRMIVVEALEHINDESNQEREDLIFQLKQTVDHQIETLKKVFNQLDQIPKWQFSSVKASKIFRIATLSLLELTSIVMTSVYENRKQVGHATLTIKLLVLAFALSSGIFSGLSSHFHSEEIERIKSNQEVLKLKSLKGVLKDLISVHEILEIYNQKEDEREVQLLDELETLQYSLPKILNFNVWKVVQRLKKRNSSQLEVEQKDLHREGQTQTGGEAKMVDESL